MKNDYKYEDIKAKRKIYSGLIALFIILTTGGLVHYNMCQVCFGLHAIPWAIGFAEGYSIEFFIYYIVLFVVLSAFVYLLIRPKYKH